MYNYIGNTTNDTFCGKTTKKERLGKMIGKTKFLRTLALLAVLASLFTVACGTDTPAQPAKPAKASIAFSAASYETGVGKSVQLDVVTENVAEVLYACTNPDIAVVSDSGLVTGKATGQVTVTATAVSATGAHAAAAECTVTVNPSAYRSLDGSEPLIRWLGRNFTADGAVHCYNTAGGFEVAFYGTYLAATIRAAGDKTPQLCVLTDGQTDPAAHVIDLSKTGAEQQYVLEENLDEGRHSVRVLKITEALTSSVAFVSLETDGYFLARPADRSYKIEVYGDSITAGHKNLRTTPAEPSDDTDKIQNGCLTYAWLAAESLQADINVTARTGIGLYSAWGRSFVMKDNWNKTYLSETDFLQTSYKNDVWEGEFAADIVLINLGTNDVWYDWDAELYETEMSRLCRQLLDRHGADTEIVLLYGMMVSDNGTALQSVAAQFGGNVSVLQLPASRQSHPRIEDNAKAADVLAAYLQTLL